MYQYLAKYFSLNKKLALPGIGILQAEMKPAQLEFVEKTLHAPQPNIVFQQNESVSGDHFVSFLSNEKNISEYEALTKFNRFITYLVNKLQSDFFLQLPGIGSFLKSGDTYTFTITDTLHELYSGISAEKLIRQNAQHTIRVGEDQKTSAEMREILHQEVKKDRWWIAAIVLSVVGIAAILYYYLTEK